MEDIDLFYMKKAIALAKKAEDIDEVPVGALIVQHGKIIARAYNTREKDHSATSHAELRCIEKACKKLGGWRLIDCTLYITLEPCAMCAGAIVNARIPKVVFGAYDLRFGALGSHLNLATAGLNHTPEVEGGVMENECRELLSSYFKAKRKP